MGQRGYVPAEAGAEPEDAAPPDERRPPIPADGHVHTEWSWDTPAQASMARSCQHALDIGLPAVAFTDHADFTVWQFPGAAEPRPGVRTIDPHAHGGFLDAEGYLRCVERCRDLFPDLRILSGVELGEPHLFAAETGALVRGRDFDRVLGSLHSLTDDAGELRYAPTLFTARNAEETMRRYLAETLRMVERDSTFGILAHLDYPTMAWPADAEPYDATRFEEEYRAVLRALAGSGRALEVNTAGPWPAPEVVGWWYQEGGDAVSFGSDSHVPETVGRNFATAAALVESHGFRPGRTPVDLWRR